MSLDITIVAFDFDNTISAGHTHNILVNSLKSPKQKAQRRRYSRGGVKTVWSQAEKQHHFNKIKNLGVIGGDLLAATMKGLVNKGNEVGILTFNNFPHIVPKFLINNVKLDKGFVDNLIIEGGLPSDQQRINVGKNDHINKLIMKIIKAKIASKGIRKFLLEDVGFPADKVSKLLNAKSDFNTLHNQLRKESEMFNVKFILVDDSTSNRKKAREYGCQTVAVVVKRGADLEQYKKQLCQLSDKFTGDVDVKQFKAAFQALNKKFLKVDEVGQFEQHLLMLSKEYKEDNDLAKYGKSFELLLKKFLIKVDAARYQTHLFLLKKKLFDKSKSNKDSAVNKVVIHALVNEIMVARKRMDAINESSSDDEDEKKFDMHVENKMDGSAKTLMQGKSLPQGANLDGVPKVFHQPLGPYQPFIQDDLVQGVVKEVNEVFDDPTELDQSLVANRHCKGTMHSEFVKGAEYDNAPETFDDVAELDQLSVANKTFDKKTVQESSKGGVSDAFQLNGKVDSNSQRFANALDMSIPFTQPKEMSRSTNFSFSSSSQTIFHSSQQNDYFSIPGAEPNEHAEDSDYCCCIRR